MAHEEEATTEKSLEYWISRATDPFINETMRLECSKSFCEQVNQELEGQVIACRLLAHKIQSPHEEEALNSLDVLDMCVRNCGQRFHNEVAKFKFLNEIIKILSPKYLGGQTSEKVKRKAIELLYSWKISLKHLPKVKQAYDMLKEQAIITQDPTYIEELFEIPPPAPKPKLASFEDDEKAKLLSQLLKSKNADDLQAANRLIKSMVKTEDQKMERISKRTNHLSMASNNARLLLEMQAQFNIATTMQQEMEIMRELADSLNKLRPVLFRYAGEAAEGDESILAEILIINDEVGKVLDEYRAKIEPHINEVISTASTTTCPTRPVEATQDGQSISLLDLDSQINQSKRGMDHLSTSSSSSECTFLASDDVLMIGGGGTPLFGRKLPGSSETSAISDLKDIFGSMTSQNDKFHSKSVPAQESSTPKAKGLLDIDALSEALIQQHLPTGMSSSTQQQQSKKMSLRDINQQKDSIIASNGSLNSTNPSDPLSTSIESNNATEKIIGRLGSGSKKSMLSAVACPATPHPTPEMSCSTSPVQDGAAGPLAALASHEGRKKVLANNSAVATLNDALFVALESIKPDTQKSSTTVAERDQIKIILHYAANKPRPDVTCTLISITSHRDQPLVDVQYTMRLLDPLNSTLKVQPASASHIPAYNPILPPSAITQIFLFITSCFKDRVPVEYTLNYKANEQQYSINGFIDVDCR